MFCRRCCEIAHCEFNFSATTGSDPVAATLHDRKCYGKENSWTPKWKLETASNAEVNHVNKRSSNIHGSSNPLQMRFPIHRRRGSNYPTNDKLGEARNSTRTSASFASRRCAVIYDSTTSHRWANVICDSTSGPSHRRRTPSTTAIVPSR